VYIAYVDESGNIGTPGSHTYTLACVFLAAERWPDVFDRLIDHRRGLHREFRIPVRSELKANYLIRGKGPLWGLHLSEDQRQAIYRSLMRVQAQVELQTFAIVINKAELLQRERDESPREVAWEFLIQRLERLTTTTRIPLMLVHDEGEGAAVRKIARKARRAGSAGSAFGTGHLARPARLLIDDPIPRDSRQSYFVQLADVSAYAAFRRIHPPRHERAVQIVPPDMWDELGTAIYEDANYLARLDHPEDPPGIVTWPRLAAAAHI